MSTEVRTESGELVGWIDSVPDEQKTIHLSGLREECDPPLGREPLSDADAIIADTAFARVAMRSEPWRVTTDQLSKLRRTSLFRPLITREMMVEAARRASATVAESLSGPGTAAGRRVAVARLAEAAVREVLAAQIEPL